MLRPVAPGCQDKSPWGISSSPDVVLTWGASPDVLSGRESALGNVPRCRRLQSVLKETIRLRATAMTATASRYCK